MSACTFFGHRSTPTATEPILYSVLEDLIRHKNVDLFYVGNQGNFDLLVRKTLKKLKKKYPHIKFFVVLAYMPQKKDDFNCGDFYDTLYPENLEKTPPQYAIVNRNLWMLNRSDYVVTYVRYVVGSAMKFKELAEKKNKTVINIADMM